MILKVATRKDLDSIEELHNGYVAQFEGYNPCNVKDTLEKMVESGNVLIVRDKGEVVGGVAGWVLPCGFTSDWMYMAMFFFVKDSCRRHTVKILHMIEEYVATTHCTKLVFSSPNFANYEHYNRFYRIMGYKELETHFSKDLKKTAEVNNAS